MNSRNQFVRSAKSYEAGGSTSESNQDSACWPPWKARKNKSCAQKIIDKKKSWARQDKAKAIIKRVVGTVGVIGGGILGGIKAYKNSPKFKEMVDGVKETLGINKNGGKIKYKRK